MSFHLMPQIDLWYQPFFSALFCCSALGLKSPIWFVLLHAQGSAGCKLAGSAYYQRTHDCWLAPRMSNVSLGKFWCLLRNSPSTQYKVLEWTTEAVWVIWSLSCIVYKFTSLDCLSPCCQSVLHLHILSSLKKHKTILLSGIDSSQFAKQCRISLWCILQVRRQSLPY